jgi:hypothetical protein
MDVDIQNQFPEMVAGTDVSPVELDTRELLPVLLPASCFTSGKWCGSFTRLRAGGIGLTWAVLAPGGSLRYVDRAIESHWEGQGLDWKALAMANLARRTEHQPGPRRLRRVNGQVFAVAFLYEDGLGPSRLLFRGTLAKFFPRGCRVAIPERSCGFAFGTDLNVEERSQVEGVINHCYLHGTRPFAAGSYAVEDLAPEGA